MIALISTIFLTLNRSVLLMCVLIAAAAVTVTREGRSSHSLGQFPLRIHQQSVYQSKQAVVEAHASQHIYQRASA